MKNEKYHTDGKVSKYNKKNYRDKLDTLNTQIT